jgi:general nucleoside transport system permease protein
MNPFDFLTQTLRISVPYLFAASGGVVAERAGIVSLALEGFMLAGAFGATLGSYYGDGAFVGLACGLAAGLACGALHALACIRFRADQVVVGIAINLLVIGLTRFFLELAFGSASNSARVEGFSSAGGGLGNPMIWIALLTVVGVWVLMDRTALGLRLRAVGEHPAAAESAGLSVARLRFIAVALSGVLAAAGGVYLALDQHQFTDNMSAGRGFIALAAVIFGRWEPLRAAFACLLFAAAETLQIQLQGVQSLPTQFVQMIPYVLVVIALAGVVGRAVPPAALGKPAAH